MSTEILQKQKTDIQQTYTNLIINDALWDRDKRIKFWSQNVKGQGHSGWHAGYSTLRTEAYSTRHSAVKLEFLFVLCELFGKPFGISTRLLIRRAGLVLRWMGDLAYGGI